MFPFDRVQIRQRETGADPSRTVSRDGWFALCEVERLRLVLEGRVEFLRGDEPLSALETLATGRPGELADAADS